MKAVFCFDGYNVDRIAYDLQSVSVLKLQPDTVPDFSMQFHSNVGIDEADNKAKVDLEVVIKPTVAGSNVSEDDLAILSVRIVGFFSHDGTLRQEQFHHMCEVNGLATLFPFLRSAVADITRITNVGVPLILPLINVAQMLEDVKRGNSAG